MTIRLNRWLAMQGIAARRKADQLIFEGRVTFNGQIADSPSIQVDPEKDLVCVDGKPCKKQVSFQYFLFNKPKGYVCSHRRFGNEDLVYDLLPKTDPPLFCIGRLDVESRGLLLFTNDGDFAQKTIHPSSHVEKEYILTVKEKITPSHLAVLERPILVENVFVQAIRVKQLSCHSLSITILEGKKRQVRKMAEAALLSTEDLCRIRIGKLLLDPSLKEGSYRALSKDALEC